MKYARVNVKCSMGLAHDINEIIDHYNNESQIYIYDFFKEVLNNTYKALSSAAARNPNCEISTEFYIYCPYSVYREANTILRFVSKNYSELYLLLEHIANLDKRAFIS